MFSRLFFFIFFLILLAIITESSFSDVKVYFIIPSIYPDGICSESESCLLNYLDCGACISNVEATSITSTSTIINWTTNTQTNSTVNYSITSGNLSQEVHNNELVITHNISLSGLNAYTVYYYRVSSCVATRVCTNSSEYSFATLQEEAPSPAAGGVSAGGGAGGGYGYGKYNLSDVVCGTIYLFILNHLNESLDIEYTDEDIDSLREFMKNNTDVKIDKYTMKDYIKNFNIYCNQTIPTTKEGIINLLSLLNYTPSNESVIYQLIYPEEEKGNKVLVVSISFIAVIVLIAFVIKTHKEKERVAKAMLKYKEGEDVDKILEDLNVEIEEKSK